MATEETKKEAPVEGSGRFVAVMPHKKAPLGSKDLRCYGTATPLKCVDPLSEEMDKLTAKVAAAEERENAKEDPYANAVRWVEEQMAKLVGSGLTAEELCVAQKQVIGLLNAFIAGDRRTLKKKAGVRFSVNGEACKPEKEVRRLSAPWWHLFGRATAAAH